MSETTQVKSDDDRPMTQPEVAAYLRIDPRTVALLTRTKGLPAHHLGHKTVRYYRDEIDRWLRNRCSSPVARQGR
jgi:excisionase family DNA binding protein